MADPGQSDDQLEQWMGNLLRVGVLLAAAVTAAGGAVYLAGHGGEEETYSVYRRGAAELHTPGDIVAAFAADRGRGLILLGVLLLIATPVARVAFSAYAFARRRDFLYVVVTLVVLALLLCSLFGVFGG